jgi:hypothetical protein
MKGKAKKTSPTRLITASKALPKYPATAPSVNPMNRAIVVATRPILIEIREPKITRLK